MIKRTSMPKRKLPPFHVKGTTDRINRIVKHYNMETVSTTSNKISGLLPANYQKVEFSESEKLIEVNFNEVCSKTKILNIIFGSTQHRSSYRFRKLRSLCIKWTFENPYY